MFHIRSHEARTISWWYSQRDFIEADPPYQRRGNIWTPAAKAYLIDSILNDFDIPKFYLADFSYIDTSLNVGQTQYAIIDGKQRFEAIFDFYSGKIVLGKEFVYYGNPSLELAGLSYRDLASQHPRIAEKFENFNLSVMSVITDDEAKINELFLRLNSSRPLSAPEYRNAMKGIVPELVRRLASHKFFTENISFKTGRGEDQQVAIKFLLTEFRGELVDTKKTQLDRLVVDAARAAQRADASESDFRRAADRVWRVLDAMTQVFIESDTLLSSQGPLVVYYWLIRTLGPDKGLREFLVNFERERRENRENAKNPDMASSLDPEYLRYDSLNRSINDAGSLQGRARILLGKYSEKAKLNVASLPTQVQ